MPTLSLTTREVDALWSLVATSVNDPDLVDALYPDRESRAALLRAKSKLAASGPSPRRGPSEMASSGYAYVKRNTTDPRRAAYKVVWRLAGATGERSRSFARKDAATTFLREREDEVAGRSTPRDDAAGGITLRDHAAAAMESWIDLRAGSLTRYTEAVENQILPFLGDLALDAIDRDVLQAWVRDLGRRGTRGPAEVSRRRRSRKRSASSPVSSTTRSRNVSPRIRSRTVPRSGPRPSRTPDASRSRPQRSRNSRTNSPTRTALAWVGATAGLRIGELLALRWRDVDLDRGTIRVVRSITESGGQIHAQSYGKTANAFRTVPIPGRTVRALSELHAWTEGASSAPVFAAAGGGTYRPGLFRSRVFAPAARRAGLLDESGKAITPHVLRHTCATWWMEDGSSPMLVARWMGHSARDGGAFVVRRYGHVSPTHGDEVVARMDARLDGTAAGVVDLDSRRAG